MKRTTTARAIALRAAACLACAALPVRPAHGLAAGDVLVTVDSAGAAHVAGSASGDDVIVTWDDAVGAYTIAGGSGTTVNGAASVSVTEVNSFVVTMGAGDDTVVFNHTPIPGNLNVHLDDGDDSLDLAGVSVRGGTKLFGGKGDDSIVVRDQSNFRKSLTIKGNDGDDTITVKNTKMHGYVRIIGGPKNDHMTLNAVQSDRAGDLAVQGDAGNDWLGIAESTFSQPVRVGMGPGSDLVTIDRSSFQVDVELSGGGADDMIHIGSDVVWGAMGLLLRIKGFEHGNRAGKWPPDDARSGSGVSSPHPRHR